MFLGWLALPVQADALIPVPSGMPVMFQEMLWDRPGAGLVYRFRFVAPEIGPGGRDYLEVAADMDHLCSDYALPKLSDIGPQPARIVISLAQESVVFGEAQPGVTQYFEAYTVRNGTCIWEAF